ncbi:MAG: hypothetical protein ACSLE0_11410 [Chitinophagaceae bacterium]
MTKSKVASRKEYLFKIEETLKTSFSYFAANQQGQKNSPSVETAGLCDNGSD